MENGGPRVGGVVVVVSLLLLQVPAIVILFSRRKRGEAFANVTIDKQINTPFLFCVSPSSCYSALWRPFTLSLLLSLSLSMCSEASCVRYV